MLVPAKGPKKGNLVARLKGSGAKKPLLLLAHIDVVEAKREDWKRDPFKLVEEEGYFYARGAADDKAMAAAWKAKGYDFQFIMGEGTHNSRHGAMLLPEAMTWLWRDVR